MEKNENNEIVKCPSKLGKKSSHPLAQLANAKVGEGIVLAGVKQTSGFIGLAAGYRLRAYGERIVTRQCDGGVYIGIEKYEGDEA